MTQETMKKIFQDTDFVHTSGTPEELRVAEYLKARCEALGVAARIEAFLRGFQSVCPLRRRELELLGACLRLALLERPCRASQADARCWQSLWRCSRG